MTATSTATFRLPLTALLAVFGLTVCITPVAFGAPWLQVLYLIPVSIAVWLVRTKTVIDGDAVAVHRVLGARRLPWADLKGLRVDAKSRVWAVPRDGAELVLPAVRARDLPVVASVSGGALPDLTAATG